jgi:PAS domain S-box-containing protein
MDTKPRLKKRYRQFFRQVPFMAALLDTNGCFLDVSDRWEKRTGYDADQLRGKDPEELATPDSARRIREEYLPGFRRTGKLDDVAMGLVARDGTVRELLLRMRAIYADDGEHLYSVAVFFETAALARAERRYEDLYHSTPAMLHTVDAEGRITDVSDHWLDKLGYERQDVIGCSILDFLSNQSRDQLDNGIREIINAGNLKNVPRQW